MKNWLLTAKYSFMTSSKEWCLAHPERAKAFQTKYRMKNRKPCRVCGQPIPYPSPGRQSCSKDCSLISRRKSYVRYREKQRQKLWVHKEKIGCQICGYRKHGSALDWHHPGGDKERRLTVHSYFTPLGKAERRKCILLCANCHRVEHVKLREKPHV